MSNNQNQNKQPQKMPSVGLDESPLSAYAKAVNEVGRHNKQSNILMGYAPPLLRWLTTIDNYRIYTSHPVLYKDMKKKHSISPGNMLQAPYQLNNVIGICASSSNATNQGFVFITDLQEESKPVIVAIHKTTPPNSNTLLFMASVYDKELSGFQNMLNYDLLCWDYGKAERFEQIYSGILTLPPHIYPTPDFGKQQRGVFSTDKVPNNPTPTLVVSSLSYNTSPLFVDYDKTERYLSQYFSDLSVNPNLYLDAEKVQKVREWTQQIAPINPTEAKQILTNIYTKYTPFDTAKQAMIDEATNEYTTIYRTQRHFITGADLPLFHQKAQQFGEEYQKSRTLTKEEAIQALNTVLAEFHQIGTAEYQCGCEIVQKRVEEAYSKDKPVTMQKVEKVRTLYQQTQERTQPEKNQSKEKGDGGRER